ncbi:MAG: PEP/pyruvate-binding domain-containing protein [Muribaculaceae bacterium]|nr:PEP/pyruvate-binding domain-containing protein [Roseburia sp.]MCM1431385.1 PEP/pyruvate-binding domain-containing protein [Muribaculaceae bacterium]MCM1491827.1 PEP/pyruvate-binding domain-containing protein [Muribaculaceae bacterium]
MAAFERILSGIPEMDRALDSIRLGDNVVWQVTGLEEFTVFMKPYVKQAVSDGRNLIYIRFADHAPLLEEQEGLRIIHVPLSHRFETFTVEIHNIIEKEGKDAFYVFDCLSELQTAWATDLMMGNFFSLTCPFLFELDTVAYFPVIRGMHSFEAVAKIRDTTQLFFDVYSGQGLYYVRPMKVWRRYSETMFMPHKYDAGNGAFLPLTDGVQVSHFYQTVNKGKRMDASRNMDSWDRFFDLTVQMHGQGMDVTQNCERMCNIMMSRDEKMRTMIKKNFEPEDYFEIKDRMIGTGLIGGKACGMLLARKIIENTRTDLFQRLEPHDSFYIGSDVFYTYIVYNGFWDLRIKQRTKEGYFAYADEFAGKIMEGSFPAAEKESFCRLLDYYGSNPIIVRSSSILEDGFGNAFAGKYESVFCANSGTLEERLADFEQACRIVYASTMCQSALDYRARRGMDQRDEQMALLVQRVSGSFYGDFFMPCAAGVGYSYSPYKFIESIDQSAGMLRLVMGLGTGAVDRVQGSYPRLVGMDRPWLTVHGSASGKHQYSQRKVDVIHIPARRVEHWDFEKIRERIPAYMLRLFLEHDFDAERMFRERGQNREIFFVSCEGLVRNESLMGMMRDILSEIQKEYDYPVDIEYTINVAADGEFVVNLLQCRPLQIAGSAENISLPDVCRKEDILFECVESAMGLPCEIPLDLIVFIDPVKYYEMPYKDKYRIAGAVNKINWKYREEKKHMLLMAPGRIGTSSPELGVPTSFADISEFDAICEIAESRAGYMPELSFGSHFFQDLVEAEITYIAIFGNERTLLFQPELLQECGNIFSQIAENERELGEVIQVYDVRSVHAHLYHDISKGKVLCIFHGK